MKLSVSVSYLYFSHFYAGQSRLLKKVHYLAQQIMHLFSAKSCVLYFNPTISSYLASLSLLAVLVINKSNSSTNEVVCIPLATCFVSFAILFGGLRMDLVTSSLIVCTVYRELSIQTMTSITKHDNRFKSHYIFIWTITFRLARNVDIWGSPYMWIILWLYVDKWGIITPNR